MLNFTVPKEDTSINFCFFNFGLIIPYSVVRHINKGAICHKDHTQQDQHVVFDLLLTVKKLQNDTSLSCDWSEMDTVKFFIMGL